MYKPQLGQFLSFSEINSCISFYAVRTEQEKSIASKYPRGHKSVAFALISGEGTEHRTSNITKLIWNEDSIYLALQGLVSFILQNISVAITKKKGKDEKMEIYIKLEIRLSNNKTNVPRDVIATVPTSVTSYAAQRHHLGEGPMIECWHFFIAAMKDDCVCVHERERGRR